MGSDVLITGLPRSGLTMVSALADSLPETVCLNIPVSQVARAEKMNLPVHFCKWLIGDFAGCRAQLLRGETLPDFRAADASPLFDSLKDPRLLTDTDGTRKSIMISRTDLKPGFTLVMKHHTLYTSVLPELVNLGHFKIIAVIRHPLDVLTSWQSFPKKPFEQGNLPHWGHFWAEGMRISALDIAPLDRMVQLYDAYLQRYHESREHIHIIKYEDAVRDPMIVSKLFGADGISAGASMIQSHRLAHSAENSELIRERIKKYGVFTKLYYPSA